MDQVHVIRHKVLVERCSVRRVAREMGVSRNTVRKYLEQPAPKYGPRRAGARPVCQAIAPRVEALLTEAPRWTGGKQRLTATRLHRMLRSEGHEVGLTTIKELVAEHRRQRREVFVPLVYPPGDLAEVDFFEVLVDLAGERRKAWMFVMRLMHSGRDFARIYQRQDQVCFLDGHVRAFEHFGAVPHRIAYDNLRAAVSRKLVGSERELTVRFEALASHYLLEACFCRPRTGHDKGGVEARGRGIRLQHLVPIPSGEDLGQINAALLDQLAPGAAEAVAADQAAMLPLPAQAFAPHATRLATVTRRSLITVEGAVYSVPCAFAGLDVTIHVGADAIEILRRGELLARHPRLRFGQRSIDYRHYIRELARKPQAVRQVAAELVRDLGAPFDEAWRVLVDVHGPKDAARVFAKVLGHVEQRGIREVAERVRSALASAEPLLLALAPPREASRQDVVLPTSLHHVVVEGGQAADYDGLLTIGGAA